MMKTGALRKYVRTKGVKQEDAKSPNSGLFLRIQKVVAKIPYGKVLTYGDVARIVGTRDARKAGWALHGNQDPDIPCHRVIKAGGYIAKEYSLGGWEEQKHRLEVEGVTFTEENRVDMSKHHWDG